MAIALVGSSSAHADSTADGFTTSSFDSTGADLLVVVLAQANNNNGSISDNKGNTYTPLTQQLDTSKSCQIFYAYNITAGTGHTLTVSGTDTFPGIAFGWFSGSKTSADPFDVQNGAHATFQTTINTGSVSPSENNELIVTGLSSDGNTNADTIDSSFTVAQSISNVDFGHSKASFAYLIQTTAGAVNPQWTRGGGSGTLGAPIATFKALTSLPDLSVAVTPGSAYNTKPMIVIT